MPDASESISIVDNVSSSKANLVSFEDDYSGERHRNDPILSSQKLRFELLTLQMDTSGSGHKRTLRGVRSMSAKGQKRTKRPSIDKGKTQERSKLAYRSTPSEGGVNAGPNRRNR